MPQVYVLDDDGVRGLLHRHFVLGDEAAAGQVHAVAQGLAFPGILDPHAGFHVGVLAVHHRGHGDARAAEVLKVKVAFRHADEVHVAVEAAVEGEV